MRVRAGKSSGGGSLGNTRLKEDLERTGVLWRAPAEIRGLLEAVRESRVVVNAFLPEGDIKALIVEVDTARLVLECGAGATAVLLARSSTAMHADMPDWHLEFMVAQPTQIAHRGAQAIQIRLPEIVVQHKARTYPRVRVEKMALQCIADEEGIIAFRAAIVDLSPEGVGFLVYPPDITLAPGTVLRGCRIDVPLGDPLAVDLEVRYSHPVTNAAGQRAIRSGCRMLDPTPEMVELVRSFAGG